MTETQPPGVLDHDHIAPPETDEELKRALEDKDFAKFFMWLKTEEKEVAHNPVQHAELLKRAAEICNEARDTEKAVSYLLLAAKIVNKKDAELERQIHARLYEFSGEEGLKALADQFEHEAAAARKEQLDVLYDENKKATQRLVDLDAYDWEKRTGNTLSEKERQSEMAKLRTRVQEIADLRAALMK